MAVHVIKFKMTRLFLIKGTPYSKSKTQRSRRSRENKGKAYMRDALISRSEKNLHDCKIESCIYYRHYNIWSLWIMYSSNVGTLALCCLFLQGFTEVTGKSSSFMKSPVAIDAGRFVYWSRRYLHISVKNGKREDSKSSSHRRLSVVMLVMGRERKVSRRRGESKQKISEKGKMEDDVDGVYRTKHVLGK